MSARSASSAWPVSIRASTRSASANLLPSWMSVPVEQIERRARVGLGLPDVAAAQGDPAAMGEHVTERGQRASGLGVGECLLETICVRCRARRWRAGRRRARRTGRPRRAPARRAAGRRRGRARGARPLRRPCSLARACSNARLAITWRSPGVAPQRLPSLLQPVACTGAGLEAALLSLGRELGLEQQRELAVCRPRPRRSPSPALRQRLLGLPQHAVCVGELTGVAGDQMPDH